MDEEHDDTQTVKLLSGFFCEKVRPHNNSLGFCLYSYTRALLVFAGVFKGLGILAEF